MNVSGAKAAGCLGRLFPTHFQRRLSDMARRLRLDRLHLVLSFDCDTPEDIDAALAMEPSLQERGIKTTYAVPAAMLERTPEAYRILARAGADFINHGARPHAEYREGRYWSINFYDRMSPAEVEEDIRTGHEIVTGVIGRAPRGFRAPHFGSFQSREQLSLQYRALSGMGYVYSTSTLPWSGYRKGLIHRSGTILEIPVSGSLRRPFSVFDSWGHVASPLVPRVTESYAQTFVETAAFYLTHGLPGLLNYYADPSHVFRTEAFERIVGYITEQQIQTLHYEDLLDRFVEVR